MRSIKNLLPPVFAACTTIFCQFLASAQTSVLTEADKPALMMENYLRARTVEAFERRADAYEKIETPADAETHKQRIREFFLQQLGSWPEKTPLNAKVMDTMDRGDYRIEKVIFESRPNFHVTALMYLPETDPPYPAVLFPCGHDPNGKAGEAYQRACAFLATNGIAALCYDPIGQGERAQILDADGKQTYGSTIEHTLVTVSSIPLGLNVASYRVWDGIRGIDYLCSRPDIDPNRIGCTGNSGGGTLTAYISALDDRVLCAAPSCYITSLEDLILVDGPHDGEQCIAGQLAFGMDHGDYLMARAPKPTLVCCATRDFFPIAGTWDTYRQAKRFYTRMGYSERLDIAEADEDHGCTPPLRQAMVRWMKRWLLNIDDTATEPEIIVLTDEEALVTAEGQVLKLPGERSVFDINRDIQLEQQKSREAFWAAESKDSALAKVRELTGIRPAAHLPVPEVKSIATARQDGYSVESLVLLPEPGIELPAVLYTPEQSPSETVIVAASEGKISVAQDCIALAKSGKRVLAVDLRNCGETKSSWSHGAQWEEFFGPSYKASMLAFQLNRPFITMWAEDLLICARYVQNLPGATQGKVALHTYGLIGPAALHAAAMEPSLIASVETHGGLASWVDVVNSAEGRNHLINVVHGALPFYDLSDLKRVIESR